MKLKKPCILFVVISLLWIPRLGSQTAGTGALTGTVTDSSGAVVPNATVTATSTDTGQARTAATGTDGTYKFGLLPPGNYRVKIEAGGFKPLEIPSVTVTVTETAVLDRALEVGAQTQSITVEGEVQAVQTESSALGSVVNTQTVVALPLSTRNYTNLLAMSAGANGDVTNSATLGKASSAIAVNGSDITQSTYLQDGVAVDNWLSVNTTQEGTLYGAFGIPNPDTIQEFKIQTSTYDASYGRNPGANVNVVTKSGSNSFHGDAFEFFRNTALNANDFFRNATVGSVGNNGSKQVLNQNQYGGVFGGPVKKEKLFFFVAYQETNAKNGISGLGDSNVTLPPIPNGNRGTCPVGWTSLSQCDAAAQAFVPALGAAVCPANNPGNAFDKIKTSGSITVACNGSNINPVAINILQLQLPGGGYLIPGSGTGTYTAANFTDPAKYKDHQGMGNWDYVINAKNTLSGRYTFEEDPTNGAFASNGTSITASNQLPGSPVFLNQTYQTALLRLTTIVSNSVVNEARTSYQRAITDGEGLSPFKNSQVGISDVVPGVDVLDSIGISGLFTANSTFGSDTRVNQFEWADQLSWTHGKHAMRTGFEAERIQGDILTISSAIGSAKFRSFSDFLIGRAACAPGTFGKGPGQCNSSNPGNTNGAQSSNVSSAGGTANGAYDFKGRLTALSTFFQDDIRVNSRLTVNAGLRWEHFGYPSEEFGHTSNLWPSLLSTVPNPGSGCLSPTGQWIGTVGGTGCSLAGFIVPSNFVGNIPAGVYQNTNPSQVPQTAPKDDFAPRLGLAWQPTSSNRLVLRAGAGLFYDFVSGQDSMVHTMRVSPSVVPVSISPSSTLAQPGILPTVIPGPFGTYGFTPRWVNFATDTNSNLSQSALATNFTVPVTYEWNLNTQYEFLRNWVFELGYVGSHGIHQFQGGINTSNPWNWALLASPTNPINGQTTNTVQNVPLRAQYLGISTVSALNATNSSYVYNALLATVRKQFSHGLQFQAAYMWDRAFVATPYGINTPPYEIMQMAPNIAYHPQRLVFNYTWNLPLGHPKGVAGQLVDGWSLSGVTVIQYGTPITIYDSSGGTVFFGTTEPWDAPAQLCPGMTMANVVTSGPITSRLGGSFSQNAYFNPAAFCPVPVVGSDGTATGYGNIGQGTALSPGQLNWDMSLMKSFKVGGLREDAALLFRAEFFNAFNHPQFEFEPSCDACLSNQDVSGAFGQITTTSVNPRLVQLALKYTF